MNIKRSELPNLLAAHKSLDGELAPKARYAVGKNIVHLARAVRDINRVRIDFSLKHSGKLDIPQDHENWQKFVDEFYAYLAGEVEVNLMHIDFEDLNVGASPVAPAALAALEPLLVLDAPTPMGAPELTEAGA